MGGRASVQQFIKEETVNAVDFRRNPHDPLVRYHPVIPPS
jgi:hypothetical protein